jgi:hypothetical protein
MTASERITQLEARIAVLEARLAAVEARPYTPPVTITPSPWQPQHPFIVNSPNTCQTENVS